MTNHLGYEKHDRAGHNSGNTRNGKSRKKLKGDFGEIELLPHDPAVKMSDGTTYATTFQLQRQKPTSVFSAWSASVTAV